MVRVVRAQREKLWTDCQEGKIRESFLGQIIFSEWLYRIYLKKGLDGYNLIGSVGQATWLEDALLLKVLCFFLDCVLQSIKILKCFKKMLLSIVYLRLKNSIPPQKNLTFKKIWVLGTGLIKIAKREATKTHILYEHMSLKCQGAHWD